MKTKLLILLSLTLVLAFDARAGSATWNLDPVSSDWNDPLNWTPNTVPNGPADVATFSVSNITEISTSAEIEVNALIFDPDASAFTITVPQTLILTLSGTGIIINSGIRQNFVTDGGSFDVATIQFSGNATAGDSTMFTNKGSNFPGYGQTNFFDDSTAGTATFVNEGTLGINILAAGHTQFFDRSSAGEGTFINLDGSGQTVFMGDSTAADGTFVVDSSVGVNGVSFLENSNAGNGNFTLNAPTGGEPVGGVLLFSDTASAANGIFTVHDHAEVIFGLVSTAGNATLIADGGGFVFQDDSSGGTARVELFDDASLEVSFHDRPGLTIGSLEGTGSVYLKDRDLTVGSNDLSTIFSGVIQNAGSLEKIGNGTLTLSGANTYTGGTTVSQGTLLATNMTGSATGTRDVQVNGGTLGGGGTVAGAITVGIGSGTGSVLDPAATDKKIVTLVSESSLTLESDATYRCTIDFKNSKSTAVRANGVTIDNAATIVLKKVRNGTLAQGKVFKIIRNTSSNPISGTFSNLADGAIVNVGGTNFQADYQGGDGNDLTLTVVP